MPGEVVRIEDRIVAQLARELRVSIPTVVAAKVLGLTVLQLLAAIAWFDGLPQQDRAVLLGRARRGR